ncbi:AMP-binding protein [Desulfonema ishimotonii]|uniref:AMP-binding protein n=1 Tax=Desulfonema ishimotonii TaxID=45657 RepID=A0A401FUT0_9BACT|nr:class I adenylate-forming enzyme family protein [Desulfonema ishimotonii]GBC60708.1 AMP-binding protein [Desulfonema ishimotonii]
MYQRFRTIAEKYPDRIAITGEHHSATYRQLSEEAATLASLIPEGAVVLIALPGGPHFTAIQLACLGAGAVAVPIPDKSTPREIRNYLALIRPDWVVTDAIDNSRAFTDSPVTLLCLREEEGGGAISEHHRVLIWAQVMDSRTIPDFPDPHGAGLPPETAMIQFTSGSTGRPKGILLSRDNLRACLENSHAFLAGFSGRDIFCPMPQFHAFGNAVVLEHLLNGSPVHLTNRFVPGDDLRRMTDYACTGLFCAPNYIRLLMQLNVLTPENLPALDAVCMGTAAADQGLIRNLREQLPDADIWLRYGLAETVGTLTRLKIPAGKTLSHPGQVGRPVPGTEIAPGLLRPDEGPPGEIRVRSGVVGLGQLSEPGHWTPLANEAGFFATGDLGYMDEAGQLHLRGRISTFIKRNGFRVNPFEIEALLRDIPGIHEAVVVGIPDPLSGERIVACAEPASEVPDTPALMKICREHLSAYKIPQRFMAVEKLPRNPAGKPDRPAIRSLAG